LNKFWLFFGIFLAFTGFGTVPGILLIVFFIWNDLKKTDIKIQNNSEEEVEFTAKYYNKETLNDMK
jgi:hypothetical protein